MAYVFEQLSRTKVRSLMPGREAMLTKGLSP